MAAGTFVVLNKAKKKLVDGTFDLDTHAWKVALCTSTFTPTAAFAGTSTNAQYSDLTGEVAAGGGYTTGGATLASVTLVESSGTITFDAADVSWSGATFSAKWAVIYNNTDTNKGILGYFDIETGNGSGLSPANGTFSIAWNAAGIFTLA
jgi:hypothetical protein